MHLFRVKSKVSRGQRVLHHLCVYGGVHVCVCLRASPTNGLLNRCMTLFRPEETEDRPIIGALLLLFWTIMRHRRAGLINTTALWTKE